MSLIDICQKMTYNLLMDEWTLERANKCKKKLPLDIKVRLFALFTEIEKSGPYRKNWKNYSKLTGEKDKYHCHIKSGKPTYVVCWKIVNKEIQITEVYYVGTHEKAPY